MTRFPETLPLPVAGLRKHSGAWKGAEASLLEKYAGLFVARGPARFFSELQGEALAAFLVERFRFFRRRSAGNYVLRVGQCSLPLPDGEETFTLVELLIEDRPFLTESVQFLLNARRIPLRVLCHPILRATRDPAGRLTGIGPGRGSAGNEVQIVVLAEELPAQARRELLAALRETLWEIIHSVDDFSAMQKKVGALQRGLVRVPGLRRYASLVSWLEAGNFIFLGFLPFSRRGGKKERAAAFEPRLKEGLGHFSPESGAPPQRAALVKQVGRLLEENCGGGPSFGVDETDVLARVHRPSPITALLFSFKLPGGRDQAIAVTGLFSDRSLRGDALEMPVVGDKIREAIGGFGLVPGSHNHKVVLDYLNGLPKIELFCLSIEGLRENVRFLLNVVDQPAIRVGYFSDQAPEAFRIVISAPGVAFPRGKLSRIRERLETMLGSPARKVFLVQVPGFGILHLVFRLANRRRRMRGEPENLTTAILEELRERKEQLLDSWLRARGPELERRVARALVNALPEDYQAAFSDVEALADLTQLERLTRKKQRQFALRSGPHPHGAKMVIYDVEQLSLSRIMPILSNLRLHVVEEQAYRVPLAPRPVYIHSFLLLPPEGAEIVPERDHEPLKRLVFGVLDDALEDDPLNALLFACGFGWRPINLMMLLRNYLMQVGTVYTKRTINETLIRRPVVTKALFGVFQARFDPDQPPSGRVAEEAACETGLADALREIDTLTEDRIFKRLLNLIRATVRTNYFRDPEHPVLAVKFDSAAIDDLPAPRPRYEIFVHGPLVEGIHLRGGMIARGGIRYSDRPDDFRTEVLGLMATQMKKNALTVPVGSKGGFVVKNLRPYGGDSRRAGDAQYANYIRALFSVTDNYVGGEVIAPERVVRRDGDDPYLVVAADKGTAHLSDTANAIAKEAGFWLGDAFASGGSNGYDHKKIAITARGAWECVKRLFWEVGVDLRRQAIRVVGIGDMAGDVFGNGMLLSRRIKLVGAFNHRHIFLDPDPNPAVSFRERERLFRRPGSAWSDYDPKALSPGGGVFSRQAKAIPLSPQARRLLGADRPEMSGEEAIRALLKLDVELIWNGGIGTYFKAAAETHAAVDDHSNDAVRIDARECRARVIGEGGNLGLTQPARIEFDLAGGLLNTDAIDNAGGVNLSDHEVNLKILLAGRMAEGTLPSVAARNRLLKKMEGAVAAAVLRGNYLQAIAISMDRLRSAANVQPYLRLVERLVAEGTLDRRAEAIPNTQQFQQARGRGVPRPVLAVLLAYMKIALFQRLSETDLAEEPFLRKYFVEYFPAALGKTFDLASAPHPLARQIITTMVTNRVVDHAGMTFVPETAALTEKPWEEVVRAYLLAEEISAGATFREKVYALDFQLPAAEQYDVLMRLESFLADMVSDFLLPGEDELPPFEAVSALQGDLAEYLAALPTVAGKREAAAAKEKQKRWVGAGMDRETAALAAWLPSIRGFPETAHLCRAGGLTFATLLELEKEVEARFQFARLEKALGGIVLGNAWQKQFGDRLRRSLREGRREKLTQIVADGNRVLPPRKWVGAYLDKHARMWHPYRESLHRMNEEKSQDLFPLAVVVENLANW